MNVIVDGMDERYSNLYDSDTDSPSEADEAALLHNPFYLNDDQFEKEFEQTLALFDALLIGDDPTSDTFSICQPGSPYSTLRLDGKEEAGTWGRMTLQRDGDSCRYLDTLSEQTFIDLPNTYIESPEEGRPKSFMHDEVSEFNRLLKELSSTSPITEKFSTRTLKEVGSQKEKSPLRSYHHHHHSSSISLPFNPHNNSNSSKLESNNSTNNDRNSTTGRQQHSSGDVKKAENKDSDVCDFSRTDSYPKQLPASCNEISSDDSTSRSFPSSSVDSDTWTLNTSRSRSTEELLHIFPDNLSAKRHSCREILQSGFFESIKSLQSLKSLNGNNNYKGWDPDRGGKGYGSLGSRGVKGRGLLNLGSIGRKAAGTSGNLQCFSSVVEEEGGGEVACLPGHVCSKDESDSAYQTGNSDTLTSSTSSLVSCDVTGGVTNLLRISETNLLKSLGRLNLEERLAAFNRNTLGLFLQMSETNGNIYQGSLRVHLNLTQPISMRLTEPATDGSFATSGNFCSDPSLYDSCQESLERDVRPKKGCSLRRSRVTPEFEISGAAALCAPGGLPQSSSGDRQHAGRYASFYLPVGVSKVIHVTSESTTTAVIKILLNKFHIIDDARKFALFQKTFDRPVDGDDDGCCLESDLSRPLTCHMRKLGDGERPLEILLRLVEEEGRGGVEALNRVQFVLQEYSSGEIIWEAFSVPELNNFLMILNCEEQSKVSEIERRYAEVQRILKRMIDSQSRSTAAKKS